MLLPIGACPTWMQRLRPGVRSEVIRTARSSISVRARSAAARAPLWIPEFAPTRRRWKARRLVATADSAPPANLHSQVVPIPARAAAHPVQPPRPPGPRPRRRIVIRFLSPREPSGELPPHRPQSRPTGPPPNCPRLPADRSKRSVGLWEPRPAIAIARTALERRTRRSPEPMFAGTAKRTTREPAAAWIGTDARRGRRADVRRPRASVGTSVSIVKSVA